MLKKEQALAPEEGRGEKKKNRCFLIKNEQAKYALIDNKSAHIFRIERT